ncbi:hypothetical protein PINS_up022093 [Pythium insidiosum]|nr:hypothetical protein PINS_up022093 [Pythium insidiosum]
MDAQAPSGPPRASDLPHAVDMSAHGPPQLKIKEDICVQMLMGGFVQSYVDLFYLTHRNESEPLAAAEMEFLRDQLRDSRALQAPRRRRRRAQRVR